MKKFLIVIAACLLFLTASTAKADVPLCTDPVTTTPCQSPSTLIRPTERHRWVGMQFDVGIPDGVALGVSVHPVVDWARLNLSGTYNGLSPGIRGGITLDPINFPMAPTLTLEGGHAFEGKVPGVDKVPSFDYNYLNLHLGLEFGNRRSWRFFLQGGPSWVHVQTHNFQAVVNSNDPSLSISDPSANGAVVPTAKLGFVLFF